MTCVVGYVDKNSKVYLGADSAGVAGLEIRIRKDPKVFTVGNYIFGFSGSFRMGQILRYKMNIPECPDWDVEKFMATTFIDCIRKEFETSWADGKKNHGGQFLVGYQGRLWKIQGDYQVGWSDLPYDAIGCGEPYALGALYNLHCLDPKDQTFGPEKKIEMALSAAENFSGGVRAPFNFVSL